MLKTFILEMEVPYYLTSCAKRGNDEPVENCQCRMKAAYQEQLMSYERDWSFRYWFRMEASGQEQFGIKHESTTKNKRVLQLKLDRQHFLLY